MPAVSRVASDAVTVATRPSGVASSMSTGSLSELAAEQPTDADATRAIAMAVRTYEFDFMFNPFERHSAPRKRCSAIVGPCVDRGLRCDSSGGVEQTPHGARSRV